MELKLNIENQQIVNTSSSFIVRSTEDSLTVNFISYNEGSSINHTFRSAQESMSDIYSTDFREAISNVVSAIYENEETITALREAISISLPTTTEETTITI